MSIRSARRSSHSVGKILLLAAWFGLVAGIVEGVLVWGLQRWHLLAGPLVWMGSTGDVVWIAPLLNLILFVGIGTLLAVVSLVIPAIPMFLVAASLFIFLTLLDWIAVPAIGRLSVFVIPLLAMGGAVEPARWFICRQAAATEFLEKSFFWVWGVVLALMVLQLGNRWIVENRAVAALPPSASGAPNILVIMIDTLRADHLSTYGYERVTSPTLDALAKEGVLFEDAYAASSWTLPSHASIFTGQYPSVHGADDDRPLDKRLPTIGEEMQELGYRTGVFSANYYIFSRLNGFARGFHHFTDHYQSIGNVVTNTLYGRAIEYYVFHRLLGLEHKLGRVTAPLLTEHFLTWIDQNQKKPYFAVLNYYDIHAPYIPPQPYRSMFSEQSEPGGKINTDWGMDNIYLNLSPAEVQGEIDAYDGAIAYVDDSISQLLANLQERGNLDNTIVVITSDHGESFGEHGLFEHHNSLYPEVIHVPLILWWPGHIPGGVRVPTPVSNKDLGATLLYLLGHETKGIFPGVSLVRTWSAAESPLHWPYPIAEVEQASWVPAQHLPYHGDMKSVISPEWQYITHETFGEELYDRLTDPHETIDLAQTQPASRLIDLLRRMLRDLAP